MDYSEVLSVAKQHLTTLCKGCDVCNGKVCRNMIPGPGAKGVGDVAIRNYDKWKEVRVNMDTIGESFKPDTSIDFLGKRFRLPIFAGPIGAIKIHCGSRYTDQEYNYIMVSSCAEAGIAAFTGDGVVPELIGWGADIIKQNNGIGIPTIKPWDERTLMDKFLRAKESNAFAYAMDIDASGLPFLKNGYPPAGRKTVEELKDIISFVDAPFIIKGIMTPEGALKAVEAGASAIIVSNHGGRVLDQCPSTAEVLQDIVAAVDGKAKILVDGGIRTGVDIFKAIALGADGVLICRPFVVSAFGGGKKGVKVFIKYLQEDLEDTMLMCGAKSLSDIKRSMVSTPYDRFKAF